MVGAVEDRPGQVVEAGVEQIKRVVVLPLDGANLGHQIAAFGDQVSARLDLQSQRMAEGVLEPPPRGIPQLEVGVQIDVRVARPIGIGKPPPALIVVSERPTSTAACSSAPQTWARCSRSVPEPMCMCRPGRARPMMIGAAQALGNLLVPDAVLRLLAAGIGLLAVTVAEAGIDPQRDLAARARRLPNWSIMSGEPH